MLTVQDLDNKFIDGTVFKLTKAVLIAPNRKLRHRVHGDLKITSTGIDIDLYYTGKAKESEPFDSYISTTPGTKLSKGDFWALVGRSHEGLIVFGDGISLGADYNTGGVRLSGTTYKITVKLTSDKYSQKSKNVYHLNHDVKFTCNKRIDEEVRDHDGNRLSSSSSLSIFEHKPENENYEIVYDKTRDKFGVISFINASDIDVDSTGIIEQSLFIATGSYHKFSLIERHRDQKALEVDVFRSGYNPPKLVFQIARTGDYRDLNSVFISVVAYKISTNKYWPKVMQLYYNLAIASDDYVNVYPLMLCVAIESAIMEFAHLATQDASEYKANCDKVLMFIETNLEGRNKERLRGLINSTVGKPRAKDILAIFLSENKLESNFAKIWGELRNPGAHGNISDNDKDQFQNIMKLYFLFNVIAMKIMSTECNLVDYSKSGWPNYKTTN